MLANDLTLDKADGTDVVYRLTQNMPDGTRRIDIASTLALPATLVIKHSTTGKAPNVVDRHLVQLNKTLATATGSVTLNANFTLTIPRDAVVTNLEVHNVIANMLDFLLDATLSTDTTFVNVDALLRGES